MERVGRINRFGATDGVLAIKPLLELGHSTGGYGSERKSAPRAPIRGCARRDNQDNAILRRRRGMFCHRRHKRQHLSARGVMAVAGGSTHAPVIRGTPGTPLFHRLESPTQDRTVAAQQVASLEIWGASARGS